VIDEDMPWKLAEELRKRGFRSATSAKELGKANIGFKDPPWLRFLAALPDPCILVTFDNKMPNAHRELLLELGSTVAVIDSRASWGGLEEAEYYRDVTHRWAHRMAAQNYGTVRKYSQISSVELDLTAVPRVRSSAGSRVVLPAPRPADRFPGQTRLFPT
jgi:hypothetical protein